MKAFIFSIDDYLISGVCVMEPTLDDLIEQAEASPYFKLLNMRIQEVTEGYARLTMNIEQKHLQILGTVHGGATASLVDTAAFWAALCSTDLKDLPITVEMKINFLAPVKSGQLIAEARSIHKGFKLSVSDVEVKDDEGKLVAKSLVTYYFRSR